MMVAAILFLRSPGREPKPRAPKPVTSIIEWKAPTDFLLATPGSELLRTVPQIGNWQRVLDGSRAPAKARQQEI